MAEYKTEESLIEMTHDQLPTVDEVIQNLIDEKEPLKKWNEMALAYYTKGQADDFIKLLDTALQKATKSAYTGFNKDLVHTNDMLGSYCVMLARRESSEERKRELLEKANGCYKIGDLFLTNDVYHLLGKAYLCLNRGDQMERADVQFSLVLTLSPGNVPALLGKASIAFNKNDFSGALDFYKKAVRTSPNCPAHVRLGMGNCFLKLNKLDKAKLAYRRTLELDPECVGALTGLAILKLNARKPGATKKGIQMLNKAIDLDSTNAMVLNHLANHFFFKREYEKAQHLAMHAFNSTENEAMRAESCYHLARCFHVEGDYDMAFSYYYQSTLIAPEKFVLPHYGLGQMYINRDDMKHAERCFEKVLTVESENYETMKILGSLYANSSSEEKRKKARIYLKKVTQQFPDDVESWIQYAQLLEQDDFKGALSAYNVAKALFIEKGEVNIPLEILNNIAALEYRMKKVPSAKDKLEKALEEALACEQTHDQKHYESAVVTTKYNLARANEAMYCYENADRLYKEILIEHPNYIDCYLRLGCIARDMGLIFVASDFFKDALKIDNSNPDARSLLGNLHLAKMQYTLAQKNFQAIVKNPATANDIYALISLANFSLQALHMPLRNRENDRSHREKALTVYRQVLHYDPCNIWATNGIGAILAHKGCYTEAESVFSLLREATAEFSDLWLNIAHLYMEKKNYGSAIQMYENCLKKFHNNHNVEIMQFLAKAYFCAGRLPESRVVLLKAFHVAPNDTVIVFNTALVLQNMSKAIIRNQHSSLESLEIAVLDMKIAHKYFEYLSKNGDRTRLNIEMATGEANHCQDLLLQAKYHVDRARHTSEEVQARRLIQMEQCLRNREVYNNVKTGKVRVAKQGDESLRIECLKSLERTKKMLKEPVSKKKRRTSKYYKSNMSKTMQYDYVPDTDSENEFENQSQAISNISRAEYGTAAEVEVKAEFKDEPAAQASFESDGDDYSNPCPGNPSPGQCESIGSDDILDLEEGCANFPVKRARYRILKECDDLSE